MGKHIEYSCSTRRSKHIGSSCSVLSGTLMLCSEWRTLQIFLQPLSAVALQPKGQMCSKISLHCSAVTTVGACCFVVSQPVKTNDFQLTCRNVDNNNKSLSSDRSLSRSWMAPTSQPTGRSADGVFGSARVVVFRRAHPLSAFMSVVEIYGHERLELSRTP